jgi:hypothetical protein
MKAAILQNLNDGVSIKVLRKSVLFSLRDDENSDKKALKEQFESCLGTLVQKGKISEEDGVYTKQAKDKKRKLDSEIKEEEVNNIADDKPVVKSKKGKKEEHDDNDEVALKIKGGKEAAAAAYASYSALSAASKMDLSKFGEQAWKDGNLM